MIVCDSKCKTCINNSLNCVECEMYRENPPVCTCKFLTLQNTCIKSCPKGFIYKLNNCESKNIIQI